MADLNLRSITLGDNSDTSKNFTISVPAVADGTLVIKRENGTPVATIDATGKVVFPGNAQTWQDVKTSRAPGTTYTNTTGLPIPVMVTLASTVASTFVLTITGLVFYGMPQFNVGANITHTFVVPAGATYSVTTTGGTPSIISWLELR